ncbi:uncharacterized protein LOC121375792 [Gigantopelta aegis]|uniref:uncharacterized protein LOC121375792 n=1 Tax=Gigantopelta aegis TaxID=1735272 RepID=UPI001B88BB25|nr:uncharacterized protein LOC121375792 [Gigantopelta aegis]
MAYQPFMFEPERSEHDSESDFDIGLSSGDELEENVENIARLGNRDWCLCGNCRPMDTVKESICCLEVDQIGDKMQTTNLQCILEHYDFPIICLYPEVLRTALAARADIRRDDYTEPVPNRLWRDRQDFLSVAFLCW